MNSVIDTILKHRSIRKFTSEKLTKAQIDLIIQSASKASTSSYMMAYSIIGVTDEEKKQQLATIANMPYVKDNGHLFVFCADLHRLIVHATPEQYQSMLANLENTEHLLVATIDAALAAQNATIAAESMGLGVCYIGSIRNHIQQVDELLDLPNHVIPLFGLAIGVPAHDPDLKPRLSNKAIYFENTYMDDKEMKSQLGDFDQILTTYYQSRKSNNRKDSWTEQMIRKMTQPKRMDVSSYVQSKDFNKC